jgi:hypothetical protein
MIQCKDCEFCEISPDGKRAFKCNPFTNIKESECIAKWQLIRLDMLLASYQQMLKWYGKLAPLQDKMLKYIQKEISDLDEADSWKIDDEEQEEQDEEDKEDKEEYI